MLWKRPSFSFLKNVSGIHTFLASVIVRYLILAKKLIILNSRVKPTFVKPTNGQTKKYQNKSWNNGVKKGFCRLLMIQSHFIDESVFLINVTSIYLVSLQCIVIVRKKCYSLKFKVSEPNFIQSFDRYTDYIFNQSYIFTINSMIFLMILYSPHPLFHYNNFNLVLTFNNNAHYLLWIHDKFLSSQW